MVLYLTRCRAQLGNVFVTARRLLLEYTIHYMYNIPILSLLSEGSLVASNSNAWPHKVMLAKVALVARLIIALTLFGNSSS